MEKGLKVLMISSDRKILEPGSEVSQRMAEYGNLVEELHIVILSDKAHKLEWKQMAPNVWAYPTNSGSAFLRPVDAVKIGKKLVYEKKFVRGQSIITAQDPFECGWAGLKVKNKWRLPLEVQLHTDPFSPNFRGFQNIVRKLFARKILRQADLVRVVGEYLKRNVSKFNARIIVLPIYIDKEKIENELVTFDLHARFGWKFVLLTVSRLTKEKNLEMALKVLAKVREKYPETGLVVVGSGPEEDKLKSKVKDLKLEGYVEFVGWQERLASYYQTANIFLQTSLFEGYGLSLIQAGLSNLPIITTPVGIAKELENGRDAYIFPVGDVAGFASGVIDLMENNYKRESLQVNMKKTLESKLLSKSDFMAKIKDNWERIAANIK